MALECSAPPHRSIPGGQSPLRRDIGRNGGRDASASGEIPVDVRRAVRARHLRNRIGGSTLRSWSERTGTPGDAPVPVEHCGTSPGWIVRRPRQGWERSGWRNPGSCRPWSEWTGTSAVSPDRRYMRPFGSGTRLRIGLHAPRQQMPYARVSGKNGDVSGGTGRIQSKIGVPSFSVAALNAAISWRVMAPGLPLPTLRPSMRVIGATSAAVPVTMISSAA